MTESLTDAAELIEDVVERYEGDADMLIPMLQDIQAAQGYLPHDCLKALAARLGIPLMRVYGVATFYASFRLTPKGRHEVTLCMGTVCHLKGSPRISEAIQRTFKVQPGGTTADRLFTLQTVNCLGACAVAPVMMVNGEYHDGVTPDSAVEIIRNLSKESEGATKEATA